MVTGLRFVLALSHSVTVVGDRVVIVGIMQIVTAAVRVLLMQSFVMTCLERFKFKLSTNLRLQLYDDERVPV